MLLGILSDTHGRAKMARAAVDLLKSRGAEYFIHCGDVGSVAVLDHLAGLRCTFVLGNTDYERMALANRAAELGIECADPFADLTLDGKCIAVTHGDDPDLLSRLIKSQNYAYIFTGHTHVPADNRIGSTRAINPGALHRAARKTVALLDLSDDRLTTLEVASINDSAS